MMPTVAAANCLWLAGNVAAARRFRRALQDPENAQLELLRRHLAVNADTAYGRACSASGIRTYADFARRVPLMGYEELESWIDRIRRGESRVLTAAPVRRLIPTSGASGPYKLIPFTACLQSEFNRAIAPWITDLYARERTLLFGPSYWSITPASRGVQEEDSVVPIGFDHDTAYLGGLKQRLVSLTMAVPSCLQQVTDPESFRYLTLLGLLRRGDLRLISIWHPSFLTLLLDLLPSWWGALLEDIAQGGFQARAGVTKSVTNALRFRPMPERAKRLRDADPARPESLWPQLRVVSAWGHAHAEFGAADLQSRFASCVLQPKGLLATEAFVTLPFGNLHPLAVRSHFFEFIDEERRVQLSHQLRQDATYEVVVTTGGGLWRYRLRDLVKVTGFAGGTPSLRFVGRSNCTSDRCGEKLSDAFVARAIQESLGSERAVPRFILLAPESDVEGLWYTLYVEGAVDDSLLERVENRLRDNPHYAWCRELGQLKPLRMFRIKSGGYETFAAFETARGRRLGEIKPALLSSETGWSARFVQERPLAEALHGSV